MSDSANMAESSGSEDENRVMPPNEKWNENKVEPKDREQSLQRQLGPQYAPGRDKGDVLKPDKLGPGMDEDIEE